MAKVIFERKEGTVNLPLLRRGDIVALDGGMFYIIAKSEQNSSKNIAVNLDTGNLYTGEKEPLELTKYLDKDGFKLVRNAVIKLEGVL